MPPPIDLDALDPKRRSGLLGGLQRFGGLLGRNFDRNATGGIDQAMGGEFTTDMRRALRSNAVMALGQMLATQGKVPISEGLHKGQERVYGAWKAGREMRRDKESRDLNARVAADMSQGGSDPNPLTTAAPTQGPGLVIPGAGGQLDLSGNPTGNVRGPAVDLPPVADQDPAAPFMAQAATYQRRAMTYRQYSSQFAAIGDAAQAKAYREGAEKAEEMAQKYMFEAIKLRPEAFGEAITGMNENNEMVTATRMKDGTLRFLNIKPKPDIGQADLGGGVEIFDKNKVALGVRNKTSTPDAANRLAFDKDVWKDKLPLERMMADATTRNAASAAIGAQASMMNANTNMEAHAMNAYEKFLKVPNMSGEAAKTLAISTTMPKELLALRAAIETGGRGAVAGMKTGLNTHLSRLLQNAADKVGRLRSGGAVNPNEEARFIKQIVGWLDLATGNESGALEAIDNLIIEAGNVSNGLDPDGRIRRLTSTDPTKAGETPAARQFGPMPPFPRTRTPMTPAAPANDIRVGGTFNGKRIKAIIKD